MCWKPVRETNCWMKSVAGFSDRDPVFGRRVEGVPAESDLAMHLNALYLRALNGFFMVLTDEGDIVYLSENVSKYLGLTQLALIGHSIFEFIHPYDEEEVKDLLMARQRLPPRQEAEARTAFFMRMKSTLVNRKRTVAIKSATWRVLHCTGHLKRCKVNKKTSGGCKFPELSLSFLLMICEPIPDPANIEVLLDSKSFLSQHNMDMKFTYCDPRVTELTGYHPNALLGHTTYEFYHSLDSDHMTKTHQILLSKGQVISGQYRFLAKGGGYVWLETQATAIYSGDNVKPQSIVCINFVLSAVVDDTLILSLDQSKSLQESAGDPGKAQDLCTQSNENPTKVEEQALSCVDVIISLDFKDRLDSMAFHFTRKLAEDSEESLLPEDFCSPALCKLLSPIFDHREEWSANKGQEAEPETQSKEEGADGDEAVVASDAAAATPNGSSSSKAEPQKLDLEMLAPYISMEEDFQLSSFDSLPQGVEGHKHPDTEPTKRINKWSDVRGLGRMLTDSKTTQPAALGSPLATQAAEGQADVSHLLGDPVVSPSSSSGVKQNAVEAESPRNHPLVFGGPAFTEKVEKVLREIFQSQDPGGSPEVCVSPSTGQEAAASKAEAMLEPTDRLATGATESETSQCPPSKDRSLGEKAFEGDQQQLQTLNLRNLKRKHSQKHGNTLELDSFEVADILGVAAKRLKDIGTGVLATAFTPTPPIILTMHLLGTEASKAPPLVPSDHGVDAPLPDPHPLQGAELLINLNQVS
ncbi:hypoxia-inducible factor 3-alpha-like isoform X2 [Narcine bancroftii]|uniref:hypoxia-inducible factor 3-alpha-like isoform X2 n=1 Tax=Narcine bancroftii TaxID=1343680 RepID=UPI003831D2F1